MNHTYIYEPIAFADYKEAIEWYNERSKIAAENFVGEVTEKIKSICANPLRYRNTYKYFRETSLKKYPYCIVYFMDEKEKKIIITSIHHYKRNPKRKYRK